MSRTFLHGAFIQENVPLADALLAVEMETSRSLLFSLDRLLMKTHIIHNHLKLVMS